jgi:hypothetical protein
MWNETARILGIRGMNKILNISVNSKPKLKILWMVIQELRWVLLAKPV